MSTKTSGYVREEFVAPADHTFTLPDSTTIRSVDDGSIKVYLKDSSSPLAIFEPHSRSLRTTPHGIVNEDRVVSTSAILLKAPRASQLTLAVVWAVIYAYWIRHSEKEDLPLVLDGESIQNAEESMSYLTSTGVAF